MAACFNVDIVEIELGNGWERALSSPPSQMHVSFKILRSWDFTPPAVGRLHVSGEGARNHDHHAPLKRL